MQNPQVWLPTVVILLSILGTFLSNLSQFKIVSVRIDGLEKQFNDLRADLRVLTAEVRDDVRRLNDIALRHTEQITRHTEQIAKLEA